MKLRIRATLLVAAFLSLLVVAGAPACAAHRDTSQLSVQGHKDYTADQVVKVVNDVTTSAITASRAGKLKDNDERMILTINKQVLDVIASNPTNWKELALSALKNARQGLPPAQAASIGPYLDIVVNVLSGMRLP